MLAESSAEGDEKYMIWDCPYDSPLALADLLQEYGFAMSKKFGQNFLISPTARQRLTQAIVTADDLRVWEIGPGIGALTVLLLQGNAAVTAFEIDHGFCSILRERSFVDESRFTLIEGDVLKTWPEIFSRTGTPDVICGNLPYNIGSICIARLLEAHCHPKRMVFTLQKEVGDRMASGPGTKLWSTLSILAQIDYEVKSLFTIKAGSFFPPPHVDSVVLQMDRRVQPKIPLSERERFLTLVSDLFSQRRKTVRNNLLQGSLSRRYTRDQLLQALAQAAISEQERAERLSIDQILHLCRQLPA